MLPVQHSTLGKPWFYCYHALNGGSFWWQILTKLTFSEARILGLPNNTKIVSISRLVWLQSTNLTDVHTIYCQGAGSTNYYWCPPPPLKLLGLPASIAWPAASLPLCQRNLWAWPWQTSYRRILGPTLIVIGEQTDRTGIAYGVLHSRAAYHPSKPQFIYFILLQPTLITLQYIKDILCTRWSACGCVVVSRYFLL